MLPPSKPNPTFGKAHPRPSRRKERRRSVGACFATLAVLGALALLALVHDPQAFASDQLSVGDAIARQQQRIAANPTDASLHNDLGNLYLLAGQTEAASQAYQRALELDAESFDAHFNLGLLQAAQGEQRPALRHFQAALTQRPDSAWTYYQVGEAQRALGHRRQAIDAYAHAFGLDSSLALVDVNPQIVANPYATEALLRSDAIRSRPAAAPASYANPTVIAKDLVALSEDEEPGATMVQSVPPAGGAATANQGVQAGEVPPEDLSGSIRPQDLPTLPVTPSTKRGGQQGASSAGGGGAPRAGAAPSLPRGRILVPQRRQVGPGDAGSPSASPSNPPAGSADDTGRGRRFRAGRRSTASLELKLVEPPELLIADGSPGR